MFSPSERIINNTHCSILAKHFSHIIPEFWYSVENLQRAFHVQRLCIRHFNCISSQVLFFAMEVWQTSHENWNAFAFLNICSLRKSSDFLTLSIYSSLTLHICVHVKERECEKVCVCISQFVSLGFMGHLDAMMKAIAAGTDWEVYSTNGVMMSRELLWNPTATGNKRLLHPPLFLYLLTHPFVSYLSYLSSLSPYFLSHSSFLCREACVCSHHTQGTAAFWSVITR